MTTKQTEGERLVKLEVKVENIESLVKKMDGKLDSILQEQNNARVNLVTKEEFEKNLNSFREDELQTFREELKSFKKRNWVNNTLSAILGAILTLLVAYFIQTIGR